MAFFSMGRCEKARPLVDSYFIQRDKDSQLFITPAIKYANGSSCEEARWVSGPQPDADILTYLIADLKMPGAVIG
jgi:hypothetical protein